MNELQFTSVSLAVSDEAFELHSRCLSADELARGRRFATQQLARRFLVARSALRILLGQWLNIKPDSVKFDAGPFGKPCLVANYSSRKLHFNVSHSGDQALIGIGEVELGVDLENIGQLPNLYRIATMVMTQAELSEWDVLVPELQSDFFYRIWVAKEACMKQTGEGLTLDPRQIEVSCSAGVATTLQGGRTWNLIELPAQLGYRSCSATKEPIEGYKLSRFVGPL